MEHTILYAVTFAIEDYSSTGEQLSVRSGIESIFSTPEDAAWYLNNAHSKFSIDDGTFTSHGITTTLVRSSHHRLAGGIEWFEYTERAQYATGGYALITFSLTDFSSAYLHIG